MVKNTDEPKKTTGYLSYVHLWMDQVWNFVGMQFNVRPYKFQSANCTPVKISA